MQIFIPSKGRSTKQSTWRRMPEGLKIQTTLVVPVGEATEYLRAAEMYSPASLPRVLECPVSGIGPTRDFILKYAEGEDIKYLMMLDDDVVLQRRREDMRITNVKSDEEYKEAVQWVEDSLLAGYIHCGWGTRFLGYASPGRTTSGRMMYCLAYNVDAVRELGASFVKGMPCMCTMEDFNMTLQLLKAGYPDIVSLEWRASPGPSNAPGGCSTWRTTAIQSASALALAEQHPGLVKTHPKKEWEGMEEGMLDVRISWRKALGSRSH